MVSPSGTQIPYLVFIGLFPISDGLDTRVYVEVNVMVTANSPAAPLSSGDTLKLKQRVLGAFPAPTGGRQAVHLPVHVH